MSFQHTLYNAIFKRSSTFALVCIGSAFFFERGLDLACDTIFENHNKGLLGAFGASFFAETVEGH